MWDKRKFVREGVALINDEIVRIKSRGFLFDFVDGGIEL